MSTQYHILLEFIKELKRRKVLRVITVYAASAFVILELADILAPSLRLPDWTVNLVLLLLCVGFVVAVILSWIYDIQPEGGIVKTEPAHKVKEEDSPKSSNSWKIASYISFVVIVALIVLNIIPRSGKKEILDKSIAVLPFHNDSPDQGNAYIINNCMVSILDNLSKIGDLKVHSRESTAIYLENPKPPREVAQELNVGYLLEAHGQKIDSRFYITVQLLDASGQIIWSKPYDRIIEKPEDQIDIQIEVSQLVAREIEAFITPAEKQRIEHIPTSNTTAYEFYQKGVDEFSKSNLPGENKEDALRVAEDLFTYALEYDSTLALAYVGLAQVYYNLIRNSESYFSEDFMDTVLILADRALSFDPLLSDAHSIKGLYFRDRGNTEQSLLSFEKALELNPNDWSAYDGLGRLYSFEDPVKAIDNFSQAILRYQGPVLPLILYGLGYNYYAAGFIEKGDSCNLEALILNGDSIEYYGNVSNKYFFSGEFDKGLEFIKKEMPEDSLDAGYNFTVGSLYSLSGKFEEAVPYWDKYIELIEASGKIDINDMHRSGYTYWMNGDKEKGEYYLNMQIEYCENSIRLKRDYARTYLANYDLAGIYAFQGDRKKAYENLRIFNQRDKMQSLMASLIKYDPLFDSIREEPEFQQIVRDVEAKYQAEHERVREWLEENDML